MLEGAAALTGSDAWSWMRWVLLDMQGIAFDMCWVAAVAYNRCTWKYNSYIYALASCMLFSYGGGFTSRLIICQTPGIWGSNVDVPLAMVVWFLIFFTPFRYVYGFLPFKLIFIVGESICWLRSLSSTVDLATSRFPGSVFAALVLGTIGGCGGGLWMRWESQYWNMNPGSNSNGVKMTFLSVLIYYSQHESLRQQGLIPSWLDLMSGRDAQILAGCLLIVWSLIAELWKPINLFGPFEFVFDSIFINNRPQVEKEYQEGIGKEKNPSLSDEEGETRYITKPTVAPLGNRAQSVSKSSRKKKGKRKIE